MIGTLITEAHLFFRPSPSGLGEVDELQGASMQTAEKIRCVFDDI